ncbi:MAG TPA: biopolymer transporter ExbD [Anaeromyxobacter sp.]|nr:biopolymer transporter ExbD [Anaeromyxobacter sp.]
MSMEVGGKGVKSDINVTPLVDVVLVLLIIFMVITPLLQRGKPVVLPEAKELSALKSGGDPIMVSVTKDGRIWVDKVEYERDALAQALIEQMQSHPGSPVLVKGDKETPYKAIRELIFEVSKTHLMGVSLAGTKIKDKE